MNQLNFNESYSYFKTSYIRLNKELSTMKEKNAYLNHKVNELELMIPSILQRTVTKDEMKEMIKEGISPIIDILTNKTRKITDVQIQKDNIDKIITSVNIYKQTKQQHKDLVSELLELLNGRIALGCYKGSISLNQMNYKTKEWKILTQKDKAHDDVISSLCELSNKRLISSSLDKTIKIWNVSSNMSMTVIITLTQHKGEIDQVITLTNNRFVSCSYDIETVKLWNSKTYEQIPIPFEQQNVPNSLL